MLQNIVIYLSFLCFIGVILSGCEGNTYVRGSLDAAESLMEDAPDSSYAILSRIDSARLDGDRESARYALLLSMALDKTCVDTTDFSILQPALDYYPEHGTPDEKLRTLYYQGRIFQNRGDDDNAMKSFVKALDYKDNTTDTLTLARCLVAQGSLYYSAYEYKEFVKNSLKAAELFAYKKRVSSQFIN